MATEIDGARALEPLDRSVRQQTADLVRQSILNFQLKPGQRLIEREFIERLGVSRTTFREALRELAAEGLVTVVAQKGARVSAPSVPEAADLYEVRSALECLAVTWFVQRADDQELRALRESVKHFKRVASLTNDTLELLRAKAVFYQVLIRGARSNALQQLLEGINARVHALRATSLSQPGRVAQTAAELEAIVAAISERDAVKASELCDLHIRNARRIALMSLQEEEPAEGSEPWS
ncbi:MAG TPA: GntR family transcriptional regulator [Acidimicrobiales bacterium]|nr:GntR family transcriptional regulator [Acidimicrobiales bacterium]